MSFLNGILHSFLFSTRHWIDYTGAFPLILCKTVRTRTSVVNSPYPAVPSYVIGRASTCLTDRPVSALGESCSTPPWASAIWWFRIRPMPLPPCLVVMNETKRLSLLSRPGPGREFQPPSGHTSSCGPEPPVAHQKLRANSQEPLIYPLPPGSNSPTAPYTACPQRSPAPGRLSPRPDCFCR